MVVCGRCARACRHRSAFGARWARPGSGAEISGRTYRKPPWMARTIGARMAARFNPAVSRLSVPGRATGRWHTVSVAVLEHEGQRYLVAAAGDTDWSLNLRAAGHGRLQHKGHVEEFTAT